MLRWTFLNPGSLCDPCLAEQLELSGMDVTMTTLNIEEQQTLGIFSGFGLLQTLPPNGSVTRKLA
jgi:hypothetical protein